MEKRIQLEMRGKKADQIKELSLDNCRSTSIVGLTDEFVNLKFLSVINVGLTSLKGFPKLPNLKKLDLGENRISGGLNVLVSNSPNLVYLNLSSNKFENLNAIEPLKELKKLEALDLCLCEVFNTENYKEKVFAILPSLKFLDGFDKDEKEAYHSDEENGQPGKSMQDGSSDLDEEEEEEDFDEEDEEGEDGEADEEGEDGELDLSYLEKENIDEESEGEDYSPEEVDDDVEEDDDDDDDNNDDAATPRGQKRKLEDTQD